MKICKRLRTEHIFLNIDLPDKDTVLKFVAGAFVKSGIVQDADALFKGLKHRERTMSTGVGGGICFPHASSSEAKEASILLIRLNSPVDYDSLDDLPVDIVLALVVPENETTLHLQILAGISRLCRRTDFLDTVRHHTDSKLLWEDISNLENDMAFH